MVTYAKGLSNRKVNKKRSIKILILQAFDGEKSVPWTFPRISCPTPPLCKGRYRRGKVA